MQKTSLLLKYAGGLLRLEIQPQEKAVKET